MTKEEAIKRLKIFLHAIRPHILGHNTLIEQYCETVRFLEEYREQREQVQWEYNHCYIGGANLGELGNEGWELCAISDEKMYILKRPKIFTPEPLKD